jgi:hypothetical protein
LWDTIGTALLLPALVARAWNGDPTSAVLLAIAGIPVAGAPSTPAVYQPSLLDP